MNAKQMKELLESTCMEWLKDITQKEYAIDWVFPTNPHKLVLCLDFWAREEDDMDTYEFFYNPQDFKFRVRQGRYIRDFNKYLWRPYSSGYNSFTELMVNECDVNFN